MARAVVCCDGAAPVEPEQQVALRRPSAAQIVLTNARCFSAGRFLIPLGIALGAELTFGQFITQNLIPVTLGNIVGGLVFM
jgi:hypothetical protein